MVNIPVPPSLRYSLPLCAASLLVLIGLPLVWRNVRRGSTKYLRLTPEGFELAQGWRSQSGEWSSVENVSEEAPDQSAPAPNAIVFVMSDGSAPTIAAASFTPGGAALRDLVGFYWQHPDHRDELTDGRALERLVDGGIDAGP